MGQALSTLRRKISCWLSWWHAVFPAAKDRDVPDTHQNPQRSRSARCSNASIESSVLVIIRNPKQYMKNCRKSNTARSLSRIQLLPQELIIKIIPYLPLSSALSLSYTCKTFRQAIEATIEDLAYSIDIHSFLKGLKESDDERRVRLERLKFLCMLERDERLSAAKAICCGCMMTHNVSLFSSAALQQRPCQRLCMGREGRLWICPHRIWYHAQLQEVEKQGRKASQCAAECGCPNGEVLVSSTSKVPPSMETYTLFVFYPILTMPKSSAFRISSVERALAAFDVNICPHMRLGDGVMIDAFHRDWPRLEGPRLSRTWNQRAFEGSPSVHGVKLECEACKTLTSFHPSRYDGSTTTIWAQVSRCIPKTVTDPAWITSLYMPEDFGRLQEDWQTSSMRRSLHNGREIDERVGQGGGIALTSPRTKRR